METISLDFRLIVDAFIRLDLSPKLHSQIQYSPLLSAILGVLDSMVDRLITS